MSVAARTRPQVATMNAVHDLPVLVARDEGYFKDEGLDIEYVTTPGMAQSTTSHFVKFDSTGRSTRSTTRAASTSTACASGAS
jgi:hypothetical protein